MSNEFVARNEVGASRNQRSPGRRSPSRARRCAIETLESRFVLHAGTHDDDAYATPAEAALAHDLEDEQLLATLAPIYQALVQPPPATANLAPELEGQWGGVENWPVSAVHMQLLPTGKVLFWNTFGTMKLWDPVTNTFSTPSYPGYNAFCAGHALLADGRILVAGGHIANSVGLPDASIYDPFTDTWEHLADMNAGRWYPSTTTMANGDVVVLSGDINLELGTNPLPQVYQADTGTWRDLTTAQLILPLYPRTFAAPNGQLFSAGSDAMSRYLDTTGTGAWSPLATRLEPNRDYGSAVMYAPGKILYVGGGLPAVNTAEVIDLNDPTPAWRAVQSMAYARRNVNATLLADGKVLITGGNTGSAQYDGDSIYAAEMWDPATETFTTLPSMAEPRWYHSGALLLPDGRVLSAGGDLHSTAEIYSPAYLFAGSRPTITSAPDAAVWGQSVFVQTPDAANITGVSLLRLGSATHAFNFDQRIDSLSFTQAPGGLTVSIPADANIAPPGYYMLEILQGDVPSVAKMLRVGNPMPLAPDPNAVYLSDLTPTSAVNGWGPYERDMSNGDQSASDGATLTLNGASYAKGLGVHANSQLVYDLNGRYTTFQADIGMDDEVVTYGSIQFKVLADGVPVFDSGVMYWNSPTQTVNLNVAGVNTLELIVADAGDDTNSDHGDWANARLLTEPAVTYLSDLTPTSETNGFGPVERDMSNGNGAAGDGTTLALNGVQYAKGLGTHANSQIVYDLAGHYTRFVSAVGMDDEIVTYGSVQFKVLADGVQVFDSGVMYWNSPTQTVDVNVAGVNTLTLIVSDGGDDINSDHGDWADARLLSEPAITYVSDLTPTSEVNGFGPVERDMSNGDQWPGDGLPLTLAGVVYPKGLGTHANSHLIYALDGRYEMFQTAMGIDDEIPQYGTVVFQVFTDGIQRFDSGILRSDSATRFLSLDVSGAQTLELIVSDGGDNINSDHGDWAGARLTRLTPVAPTDLVAAAAAGPQVELSWTDNSPGEDEFKIFRRVGNAGPYQQIGSAPANATQFVDTNVVPGTQYSYRVRAANPAGDSTGSNVADVTVPIVGDMNGDGAFNNFDIGAFEMALVSPQFYLQQYPALTDYVLRGDVDGSLTLNNFDIGPFEQLLTGQGASTASLAGADSQSEGIVATGFQPLAASQPASVTNTSSATVSGSASSPVAVAGVLLQSTQSQAAEWKNSTALRQAALADALAALSEDLTDLALPDDADAPGRGL